MTAARSAGRRSPDAPSAGAAGRRTRDRAGGNGTRGGSTRERILDVALRRFTEQGFDATSLQEIADELGVTKAALYYHYRSKEDILMALHLRMHEFGRQSLEALDARDGPVTLEVWESLLTSLVGEMLAQRPLFLMHERNQAVLERLHAQDHDAEHEDLQDRLRRILSDRRVPLRDRVRMTSSLGATFSVLLLAGEALGAETSELAAILRDVVHDLLGR